MTRNETVHGAEVGHAHLSLHRDADDLDSRRVHRHHADWTHLRKSGTDAMIWEWVVVAVFLLLLCGGLTQQQRRWDSLDQDASKCS